MTAFALPHRRAGRRASRRVSPSANARRTLAVVETLEQRQLLSATVGTALTTTSVPVGASPSTIDLSSAFRDPSATLVDLTTNVGTIELSLTPTATPKTVANFLHYVTSGEYNGTIFHRSVPGFIVQGGGFTANGSAIPTIAAVPNEFSPSRPNVAGTIAMAKLGNNPNSATDQWFINLGDNSSNLDHQNGGFTVFGTVINGTMSVVDSIAGLQVVDGSAINGAFTNLPVLNSATPPTTASNLVTVASAQVVSPFTYTVTTDNPALVAPAVSGTALTLNYATPGLTGIAHVTVITTDSLDGSTAKQTFLASVGELPVTIGTTGVKSVAFLDSAGKREVVSLSGPGTATVSFAGTGLTQTVDAKHKTVTVSGTGAAIAGISTTGTTAKSALKVAVARGGVVSIGGLTTDAAIGSISAPAAGFTGSLTAGGIVGKLNLGAVSGAAITLQGTAAKASTAISLGAVSGTTVTSSVPIKSLTVKGNVTGSTITLTGATAGKATDLGKFVVTGTFGSSRLDSGGNLGSISAAASTGSFIYAGVVPAGGAALPSTAGEFVSQSSIGSISIGTYTGTDIAAFTLGKLSAKLLHVTNGGVAFGIAGHTIASVSARSDAGPKVKLHKVTSAAVLSAELTKEHVTLTGTDLVISII